MAVPTITINSSGSDTQASGSGGTAIFGTAASYSGSVFDLSADAPNLSGVATDGSATILVVTSTGARHFPISATDNTAKTVTVTGNTPAGTTSGLTWAIGGKLATLAHANTQNLLTTSILAGWTVLLEGNQAQATTPPTLRAVGDTTTGPVTIKGDDAANHRIITQSANDTCFNFANSTGAYRFENLKFRNTNVSKTTATGLVCNGTMGIAFKNCVFGDASNPLLTSFSCSNNPSVTVEDCYVTSTTSTALSLNGTGQHRISATTITACAGNGIHTSGATGSIQIIGCLIYGNTGKGINKSSAGSTTSALTIRGNTIHGNTGDGIDVSTAGSTSFGLVVVNNQITGNGGYGLNGHSLTDTFKFLVDYNNFGTGATANTSGARNNVSAGSNDLAVDPGYSDAAGGNFAIGPNTKAEGYPDSSRTIGANQGSTTSFVDIGAAQRREIGISAARIPGGI